MSYGRCQIPTLMFSQNKQVKFILALIVYATLHAQKMKPIISFHAVGYGIGQLDFNGVNSFVVSSVSLFICVLKKGYLFRSAI